jgi:hypothetical protein
MMGLDSFSAGLLRRKGSLGVGLDARSYCLDPLVCSGHSIPLIRSSGSSLVRRNGFRASALSCCLLGGGPPHS